VIHLDTSFLVHALAAGTVQDQRVRAWLAAGETLGMSAVAWAEFLCGPVEPAALDLLGKVVTERAAFGEGEAMLAARLFNESGRRRGSFADCLIAAAAIRAGVSLATDNPRDFRRFAAAGLTLAAGAAEPEPRGGTGGLPSGLVREAPAPYGEGRPARKKASGSPPGHRGGNVSPRSRG
jgi:predicted nucleic acid-binding protein